MLMNESSYPRVRSVILAFAAILLLHSIWLLLAQTSKPSLDELPTDLRSADAAAAENGGAMWAASIGVVRGDLWAVAAFTDAHLLWGESTNPPTQQVIDQAQRVLDRTIRYAPHRASAWLLLAALSVRYRWTRPTPAEALRMSYYTGPNELPLVPLRLLLTGAASPAEDLELQDFVNRDLRLLLARQDKTAILQAYQRAIPAWQSFMAQSLRQMDPGFTDSLKLGAQ